MYSQQLILSLQLFYKQVKNVVVPEEKSTPLKESVDTTKVTPKFVTPYVEDEHHPDKNVRNLPADLSKWPPGEMGQCPFNISKHAQDHTICYFDLLSFGDFFKRKIELEQSHQYLTNVQ